MTLFPEDKPRDECGVFGIYGHDLDVSRYTYYGLIGLQHRGQESAGIAVSDGESIELYKNLGLVSEVFQKGILKGLKGHIAVGHVRYSTTGSNSVVNAQPLMFNYLKGTLAIAHNGNLTNAERLRNLLSLNGSVFQSSSDTEIFVNLIARYGQDELEDALKKCMIDIKGAYSLVIMAKDKLIGVRDPFGVRPLCIGRLGDGWVLSSESCALDNIGATFLRDVEPGEIVIIDENGLTSHRPMNVGRRALCIFELVYLARPDSVIDGYSVNKTRREMGKQLFREHPIDGDCVIPVPDSGLAAALGYAQESGIPYKFGLMKNRYVNRTFIQPTQEMRDIAVSLKINPIREVLEGKKVILVDDSIVRGTTSRKIVKMLRKSGVREIHLVVSSPEIHFPCYYGIDTSNQEELIARRMDVDGIREHIGVDSLHFLSLEGMLAAAGQEPENFCNACFSGDYPVEVTDQNLSKGILEKGVSR